MIDLDLLDEYKARVADRYTATELVDLLDLDVWQIIEAFEDTLIETDIFEKEQQR